VRLPVSKIYRAFPELDRFSDEECREFVRTARQRHRLGEAGVGCLAAFLSIATIIILMILTNRFGSWLSAHVTGRRSFDGLAILSFILSIAGGLITGLVIRDCWLRGAIRSSLRSTRCGNCAYSLLGLPVRSGEVVCPECGATLVLALIGLTEADPHARPERDHPTSASPNDSP